MEFEEWWSKHGIEKADILPVLKLSFKELAKSAWESALYNNASQPSVQDGRLKSCHYDLKCDYEPAGPNCGQCDYYYAAA